MHDTYIGWNEVMEQPPRSIGRLIFTPEFGSALLGKVVMVTAFWAQTMVYVVLAYERSGSAVFTGIVTAVQLLPQIALALVSGSLADRHGPMIPIVAGGVCAGVGCIGLALWFTVPWATHSSDALVILLTSLVCGIGIALASAAMQAVPPLLVRKSEASRAMSLNFLPTSLARTCGPILASLLVAWVGTNATLYVVGAVCFASAAIFVFLRRLRLHNHAGRVHYRLSRVLGHVRRDRRLIAIFVAVAAIGSTAEAAVTLAPALGADLGQGGAAAGIITGSFGIGGFVGVILYGLITRFVAPQTAGAYSMVTLAVCMAAIGVWTELIFSVLMLAIGGCAMVVGITGLSVLVQRRTPPEYLGRVMAVWILGFTGIRPLAGVALGYVADHFSIGSAMVVAGLVSVVALVAFGGLWKAGGPALGIEGRPLPEFPR